MELVLKTPLDYQETLIFRRLAEILNDDKKIHMKKIILFLALLASNFAGAQSIISTNILPLTYITGTNNSFSFLETNVYVPKQRLILTTTGITNNNALGPSNIVIRLQLQASNDWVTLETFYPSATNALSDSIVSEFGKITLPLRVQVVTTNALGVQVYSQRIVP